MGVIHRYRACLWIALALPAAHSGAVYPHHAMAPFFDVDRRFSRTGVLTELDWRFPHVSLFVRFQINDDMERWSFEGPAPAFFGERDVGRDDFEAAIGRSVTVDGSPARDGSASALLRQITLADGTVVSACPQNC